MDNTQWGFSAVFPCQSQLNTQPVSTKAGNVTLVMYMCTDGETAFFVGVTDYPAGAITQQQLDDVYNGVANGAATNSNGTLRSLDPSRWEVSRAAKPLSTLRPAIRPCMRVSLLSETAVSGVVLGADGPGNSQTALDFLNAFALK